jgi:hypothetical protein
MVLPMNHPHLFGFHKVCARWAAKQLTALHKQTCLDMCQQHFDRYGNESEAISESSLFMNRGSLQAGE